MNDILQTLTHPLVRRGVRLVPLFWVSTPVFRSKDFGFIVILAVPN